MAVFEPGERVEMRLQNLGCFLRHHIEQVAIAIGEIVDSTILTRRRQQANSLTFRINHWAGDKFKG